MKFGGNFRKVYGQAILVIYYFGEINDFFEFAIDFTPRKDFVHAAGFGVLYTIIRVIIT